MKPEVRNKLITLNQVFYHQFARSFAETRGHPQPGFRNLMKNLPDPCKEVLDIGCGNGRFGQFLLSHRPDVSYCGVDFSDELLNIAKKNVPGVYSRRDISRSGFIDDFGAYDLIVCLAVMQHLPGKINRIDLLRELGNHLSHNGRIFLANWQFIDSERQKRKIVDWQTIGLEPSDLDPNDYLLSWQRDGFGVRYVCLIDATATMEMAEEVNLIVLDQFREDGREGNLNLYTILAKN